MRNNPTFKEVFESDNWIITKILQGPEGTYRIDAKRRFPVADKYNFCSKWGKTSYLNRLAKEKYGKKLSELSGYQY